jgi:hypothetical protein
MGPERLLLVPPQLPKWVVRIEERFSLERWISRAGWIFGCDRAGWAGAGDSEQVVMGTVSTAQQQVGKTRLRSTPLQRWTLGLASVATFVVVLDLLVVATALTAIRRDLGASVAQLEWTVNAYTLSFAVLLMTAAALGDRFGRRRFFAVGLALFGLASAACALAPNVGWLIAARAVQGAGAATIMPARARPDERRLPALAARLGGRRVWQR